MLIKDFHYSLWMTALFLRTSRVAEIRRKDPKLVDERTISCITWCDNTITHYHGCRAFVTILAILVPDNEFPHALILNQF